MKIEFTDEQLTLLKDVLGEYTEMCYQDMFEYQHAAVDAEDEVIRKEYSVYAQQEETRFNQVKALGEYIGKYEELFKK